MVGLPHYTIWHLYEPSVDDIKHMEVSQPCLSEHLRIDANASQEMEQDRLRREQEEKEKAEKAKKIKEEWADPNSQWEKDKAEMQNLASKEKSPDGKAPTDNPRDPARDAARAAAGSGEKKQAEAAPVKAEGKKDEGTEAKPKEQS